MSCTNCGGPQLPDCDTPKILVCVRKPTDPFPSQAWAVATCVANSVTAINLFSDEDGLIPFVGYTIADRVPCSTDMEQITAPINQQLRETQQAITTQVDKSGEEVEAEIVALRDLLNSVIFAEDSPTASGSNGFAMLAMRQLVDSPSTDADGDYTMFKVDEEGRLKVSTKPASFTLSQGPTNTVNQSVSVDVSRASNVSFHLKNTGTAAIAAGAVAFEASLDSTDGVNGTWASIQALASNTNTIATSHVLPAVAIGAGAPNAFEASVNGYNWFRIRNTVAVTANANALWSIQRGSYATEPIPAAQVTGTQPVSGSVTVVPVAGTAFSLNSAAGLNLTAVSAAAASLHTLYATNGGVAVAYLKLYNKTTAPVVATDVPVMVIPIPAASGGIPGVATLPFGFSGQRFSAGIAIAITNGFPDTDGSGILAGQVKLMMTRST